MLSLEQECWKKCFDSSKLYVNVYINRFQYLFMFVILQIFYASTSEAMCIDSRWYQDKQCIEWIRMGRLKEKGRIGM